MRSYRDSDGMSDFEFGTPRVTTAGHDLEVGNSWIYLRVNTEQIVIGIHYNQASGIAQTMKLDRYAYYFGWVRVLYFEVDWVG
jgi:hypothetical protein